MNPNPPPPADPSGRPRHVPCAMHAMRRTPCRPHCVYSEVFPGHDSQSRVSCERLEAAAITPQELTTCLAIINGNPSAREYHLSPTEASNDFLWGISSLIGEFWYGRVAAYSRIHTAMAALKDLREQVINDPAAAQESINAIIYSLGYELSPEPEDRPGAGAGDGNGEL